MGEVDKKLHIKNLLRIVKRNWEMQRKDQSLFCFTYPQGVVPEGPMCAWDQCMSLHIHEIHISEQLKNEDTEEGIREASQDCNFQVSIKIKLFPFIWIMAFILLWIDHIHH